MKSIISILTLFLAITIQASELPNLLRQAADQIERIDHIESKVEKLGNRLQELESRPEETITERIERQGFLLINDPDLEGESTLERYNNAVRLILETWGYAQWENPHVMPKVLPNGMQQYRAQQVQLPSIKFPPGHFDFEGTMWIHPRIAVEGSGQWATRLWFKAGIYEDDRGWWREKWRDLKGGPVAMLPVCIGIPSITRHENGQEWGSFSATVKNLDIKAAVPGGQVLICLYGAHTNPRIENVHLVADTHRDLSIGINHVPQSTPRELPWGSAPAFGNEAAGYVTHILDGSFKDIMVEFCHAGVVITGMGIHVEGLRTYYTLKGLHLYGNSSRNNNPIKRSEVLVSMTHNESGLDGKSDQSIAAIITDPGVPREAIKVASESPVWHGIGNALEKMGGFNREQKIW